MEGCGVWDSFLPVSEEGGVELDGMSPVDGHSNITHSNRNNIRWECWKKKRHNKAIFSHTVLIYTYTLQSKHMQSCPYERKKQKVPYYICGQIIAMCHTDSHDLIWQLIAESWSCPQVAIPLGLKLNEHSVVEFSVPVQPSWSRKMGTPKAPLA